MAFGAPARFDPFTGAPVRTSYTPPWSPGPQVALDPQSGFPLGRKLMSRLGAINPAGLPGQQQPLELMAGTSSAPATWQGQLLGSSHLGTAPPRIISSTGQPIPMTRIAGRTPFSELRNPSLRDLEAQVPIAEPPAIMANGPTTALPITGQNAAASLPYTNLPAPPPGAATVTPSVQAANGFPNPPDSGMFEAYGGAPVESSLPSWARLSGGGFGNTASALNLPVGGGTGKLAFTKGLGGAIGSRVTTGLIPMQVQGVVNKYLGAPAPGSVGEKLQNNTVNAATAAGLATGNPLIAATTGAAAAKTTLQNEDPTNQKIEQFASEHGIPSWAARAGENVLGAVTGGSAGRNDVGGKIMEGLGGLFGLAGGGGEGKASAEEQKSQQEQEQAALMTPDNLKLTMRNIGLQPEYAQKVLDNYQQTIALTQANPYTPVLDGKYLSNDEYAALKPDEQKNVKMEKLDPSKIAQSAYQQALGMIQPLRAQQDSDQDFIQRQSAMQGALQQQIPAFLAPYQQATQLANAALGQDTSDYGGFGGIANLMQNQFAAQNANQQNYWAHQLATMPGQLAAQQNFQDSQSIANQVQQQKNMQFLQANYPDLFPSSSSSGGANDIIAAALQDNANNGNKKSG